jgi:S-methylmethionine-dependent homocysteine/selenocysteine methylase
MFLASGNHIHEMFANGNWAVNNVYILFLDIIAQVITTITWAMGISELKNKSRRRKT